MFETWKCDHATGTCQVNKRCSVNVVIADVDNDVNCDDKCVWRNVSKCRAFKHGAVIIITVC